MTSAVVLGEVSTQKSIKQGLKGDMTIIYEYFSYHPWNCRALAIVEDEVVVILHAQGEGPRPVRLALPHDPLPLLQLEIPALEKYHPELAIVAFECLPEFLRGTRA